jgi:Chromo (CHRromatin Organisation MOdifier) domain
MEEEVEEYEYEYFEDIRKNANGGFEVLFKWKGFSKSHNTWEPIENIEDDSMKVQLLEDLVEKVESTKKRKKVSIIELIKEAVSHFKAMFNSSESKSDRIISQEKHDLSKSISQAASKPVTPKRSIVEDTLISKPESASDTKLTGSTQKKRGRPPKGQNNQSPNSHTKTQIVEEFTKKIPIQTSILDFTDLPINRITKVNSSDINSNSNPVSVNIERERIPTPGKSNVPKSAIATPKDSHTPNQDRSPKGDRTPNKPSTPIKVSHTKTPLDGSMTPPGKVTPHRGTTITNHGNTTPQKPSTPMRSNHISNRPSQRSISRSPTRAAYANNSGNEHLKFMDKYLLSSNQNKVQGLPKTNEKIVSETMDHTISHPVNIREEILNPRSIPTLTEIKKINKDVSGKASPAPKKKGKSPKSKGVTPSGKSPAKGISPAISGKPTPNRSVIESSNQRASSNIPSVSGKHTPSRSSSQVKPNESMAAPAHTMNVGQGNTNNKFKKNERTPPPNPGNKRSSTPQYGSGKGKNKNKKNGVQPPPDWGSNSKSYTTYPDLNMNRRGLEGENESTPPKNQQKAQAHSMVNEPSSSKEDKKFYFKPEHEALVPLAMTSNLLASVGELPEKPTYIFEKDDGVPSVLVQGKWYTLEQIWRHDPEKSISYTFQIYEELKTILFEYHSVAGEILKQTKLQT